MFGIKRTEERSPRLEYLEGEVKRLKDDMSLRVINMVTCENCGCAVMKDDAIRGKSVVSTRDNAYMGERIRFPFSFTEEYVKKTYYCKRCAKKQAKQK